MSATADSRRGSSMPRWTDEQVKTLLKAVEAAATTKAGIEDAAKRLGKSTGTVQAKYYALQRKTSGGARRPRRAAGRPAAATTSQGARTSGRSTGAGLSIDTLRDLTTDDLSKVARAVKSEIDRREKELAELRKLFG